MLKTAYIVKINNIECLFPQVFCIIIVIHFAVLACTLLFQAQIYLLNLTIIFKSFFMNQSKHIWERHSIAALKVMLVSIINTTFAFLTKFQSPLYRCDWHKSDVVFKEHMH